MHQWVTIIGIWEILQNLILKTFLSSPIWIWNSVIHTLEYMIFCKPIHHGSIVHGIFFIGWFQLSWFVVVTIIILIVILLLSVLINQFMPPTFCLCFAFTGIKFRGMLHHVCDVAYDENMCGPIRTLKCRRTNLLINYMYYLSFFTFSLVLTVV